MDAGKNERKQFLEKANSLSKKHFDDTATTYDDMYGEISPEYLIFIDKFLTLVGSESLIADVACGTGRFIQKLSSENMVIGFDQSVGMLDIARQKHPLIDFRQRRLQDLDASDCVPDRFNGLVCIDALEWVMQSDFPDVLARFKAILRDSGYAYINLEIPGTDEQSALAGAPEPGARTGEVKVKYWYNYFPPIEQVIEWLEALKFDIIDIQACKYYNHVIIKKNQ